MKNPVDMFIKVPRIKERRHRELFEADSPYLPRIQKPKTQWQRRSKHKNRDMDE
jgi:hypothetical protein